LIASDTSKVRVSPSKYLTSTMEKKIHNEMTKAFGNSLTNLVNIILDLK
jgi:hypothetical protein